MGEEGGGRIIVKYLTKCSQLRLGQRRNNNLNDLTKDTLVANMCEILLKLKEIGELVA